MQVTTGSGRQGRGGHDARLKFAATLLGVGLASGWALRCQTPPQHMKLRSGEQCVSCHQSDFQSASQPLHDGVLSTDCSSCHDNQSWAPARGSNHAWPLEGAHASARCNACHTGQPVVYDGTLSQCVDCHGAERDRVVEPSHADFSDDCQSCHGSVAWRPASIEHEWPLEGAHAQASCTSCHVGDPPLYDGTPDQCIGCHADERAAVTQPPHDGFAEDCRTCHTAFAWKPAAFPAHQWPLDGAHASATCASCHGDPPAYEGTPTDCVSCHELDRAQAVAPPHDGFSSDCQTCHGTASWSSASFVHTASFPLTGAHESTECATCHVGTPAVFAGTASECVACHQQDYDTSPFPGHSAFATSCQDCHTTSAWQPASGGTHPQARFSITGRHDYACNDCHDPSRGANGAGNTDCVGCHDGEHTLARMDAEHAGEVRNYPTGADRAPNFCLQCHPDGSE
jgi:hypothetical protein